MKLTSIKNNPTFGLITTRAINAIRQQSEDFVPSASAKSTSVFFTSNAQKLDEEDLKRLEKLTKEASKLDRVIIDCAPNDTYSFNEQYEGLNVIGILKGGKLEVQYFPFKKSQINPQSAISTLEKAVDAAQKANRKNKFFIINPQKDNTHRISRFPELDIVIDDKYNKKEKTILQKIYGEIASHIYINRK